MVYGAFGRAMRLDGGPVKLQPPEKQGGAEGVRSNGGFRGAFMRKSLPRTLQVIGATLQQMDNPQGQLDQFAANEAEAIRQAAAEAALARQQRAGKIEEAQQQTVLDARSRYADSLTPEQRDEFTMDPSGYMERHRAPVWQDIPRNELPAGARDGQRNTETGQRQLSWAPTGGNVSLNLGSGSDAVVDNLARRFNLTGQLPTGISRDRALVREIYTRAAQLAEADGLTPEQATFNGSNYQANAGGLRALQRQRTMVQAFERTALSNLELVQRLSREVPRSDYPLVNQAIMTGQRQTGDTAVARYVNALIGARTEYARVLSGATGAAALTDSARAEAEEMFSSYASPDQTDALVDVARTEMHNRIAAFDAQEAYLREQMTGQGGGGHGEEDERVGPRLRWNPYTMRPERASEQSQGRRRVFNAETGRLE